jgi:hypothetical protein
MTEQSETLAKLADALAKAQGAMKPANRDKTNPFFKSKYADLASVWEAIRKPLADNGLAITQAITETTAASITVETRLLHASGEYITSVMSMPTGKGDIQALGSAISYGRRYALSALVGVVSDEEDDGEAAKGAPAKPAPKPVEAAPAPVAHAVFTPTGTAVSVPGPVPLAADIKPLNDWYIKDDARAAFWAAAKAAGYKTKEDTMAKMGIASMRLWPGTLAQAIDKLQPKKELAPFEGE